MTPPIAVVGMGGVFPGGPDPESFWALLRSGQSAIREVPPGRWTLDPDVAFDPGDPPGESVPDRVVATTGGFLEPFTPDLEGLALPASRLERLDPVHHVALAAGRAAVRSARMDRVNPARVGVILGNLALPTESSSALTCDTVLPFVEAALTGRSAASATRSGTDPIHHRVAGLPAAVVARALGFGGGSYALDAACASSLYAIKLAADELAAGRADAMLAGGVCRPDALYTQMGFSQLRALSPSGRCSPLDTAADGLVVGEGAGLFVLKRLPDAVAHGDRILARVAAVGLSNDVRGNILAPDSEGQLRAMRAAYSTAGWRPRDVDYVECHATGTPVGDRVEIASLHRLWAEDAAAGDGPEGSGRPEARCYLGAVKASVGHMLTAAGAAGLAKVLLALGRETVPPAAGVHQPAGELGSPGSPFTLPGEALPWVRRDANTPRRAAVSAFGLGGINAHLLLEEWPADAARAASPTRPPAARIRASRPDEPDPAPGIQVAPERPGAGPDARLEPVAVVGLGARLGPWDGLARIAARSLGREPRSTRPLRGWELMRDPDLVRMFPDLADRAGHGWLLEDFRVPLDRFRIPPRELEELLPQQQLMLMVAAAALEDAGLASPPGDRTGVIVGLELDPGTNNFHLRWTLESRVEAWNRAWGLGLDPDARARWCEALKQAVGPPLTANRTMGALAPIVASRIARFYRIGGPSFAVAAGENSGLRALEVGCRLLQQGELDVALVGAVDLAGDLRSVLGQHGAWVAWSGTPDDGDVQSTGSGGPSGTVSDTDRRIAAGPGEGAVALVLKRLETAVQEGDRIYGVIAGLGGAGPGRGRPGDSPAPAGVVAAGRAWMDARGPGEADVTAYPPRVEWLELPGSPHPQAARREAVRLLEAYGPAGAQAGGSDAADRTSSLPHGEFSSWIGHTGAVSGLASLVRVCLGLHGRVRPAGKPAEEPEDEPRPWVVDRSRGPRRSAVASLSAEGEAVHVILEGAESAPGANGRETRDRTASQATARPGRPGPEMVVALELPRIQVAPLPGRPAVPDRRPESRGPEPETVPARGSASLVRHRDGNQSTTCPPRPDNQSERAPLKPPGGAGRVDVPVHEGSFAAAPAPSAGPDASGRAAAGDDARTRRPDAPPLLLGQTAVSGARARAHAVYLDLARRHQDLVLRALEHQQACLSLAGAGEVEIVAGFGPDVAAAGELASVNGSPPPRFDRDLCLAFAVGTIAEVLGSEFAPVDGHPTRVRLPDEPLMLVDRIVELEGAPRSLQSGRIVTEHDVRPDGWYLDAGRLPPGITIEAGQADLFLCAYLGIDFETRGLATYRLLDAAVTFHRALPRAGEVVRYDIHIDRFFRQGDTWLFRFRFEGTVRGEPLLTMRDGCAGFFTDEDLARGKGIVQADLERGIPARESDGPAPEPGIHAGRDRLDLPHLNALRAGDLAGAFGPAFQALSTGGTLPLTVPDDPLGVIHRVSALEPEGGRYGRGFIRAEQDIDPTAWYLTCHFPDDPVMPGTLMYECSLHALRVFLLHQGWVGDAATCAFEPLPGVTARLKCRGQVTGATRVAAYEVHVKEMGYGPEPYAVADTVMFADGRPIVHITGMAIRLTGVDPGAIRRGRAALVRAGEASHAQHVASTAAPPLMDHDRILAFASGRPSDAYGTPYRPFDEERFIARLPAPPFNYLHRVVRVEEAEPWRLQAGGTVHAEFDVDPMNPVFAASRQSCLPYAALLEAALQACGWMAAYMGAALTSAEDLHFRNLGGEATQHAPVPAEAGTLRTSAKVTNVSRSADMILLHYTFTVQLGTRPVLSGTTSFGFFTPALLRGQAGLRDAEPWAPDPADAAAGRARAIPDRPPFPGHDWRMLDQVDLFLPDGGPHGLGFLRGHRVVDPAAWYFAAHFLDDPVWPGSLGLEAFLQLLQVAAHEFFGPEGASAPLGPVLGKTHRWVYRGQVTPRDRRVVVEAAITRRDSDTRLILADGYLMIDGRPIYRLQNFGVQPVPRP